MESARINALKSVCDTGWLCFGDASLHLILERLRRLEHGRVARCNCHCFSRGGVTAFSGITMLHTERTEAEKLYLFAGGDCQSGPATVIRAVNAGKVAAANIDGYLGFNHTIDKHNVDMPPVTFKGKVSCARCELTMREASERKGDWTLVERGLSAQEAHQEASRCLRCDHFGFGAFRGGRIMQW